MWSYWHSIEQGATAPICRNVLSELVMYSVLQCLYSGPFLQTDQQAGSLDLLGPHSWFQVLEIVTTHCTAITKVNNVLKRRVQLQAPAYLVCISGLTNGPGLCPIPEMNRKSLRLV